ncbi:MAG: hypothetical protein FWF51_06960 [Chitinivibrionia bacterium]|nr:hypothetical protein [Chitinivibrionia bacterium]
MKKLLKKIFKSFWFEFWGRTPLYGFVKTRCQRNDDEIELKSRLNNPLYLERFGFKVYSENDEDGIIEEIFNRIKTVSKTFVEFGVQNGLVSNGHYLLHKGWKGLWIEAKGKSVNEIRRLFKKPIDDKRLTIINSFITKDNINNIIEEKGKISGEIDLLSIDIDGNDYWVWEAIKCVSPRVVVIEYNAKFPPNFEWVMEYDLNHIWQRDDKQGASLKSLELLGSKLGYQLVATNVRGVNAFFVKQNLANDLFFKPPVAEKLYNPTRWTMQYISGHPSTEYIGK